MLKQGKIEVNQLIIKRSKREQSKLSFFFVAFLERGREKRHLKIHFTMDYVLKEALRVWGYKTL